MSLASYTKLYRPVEVGIRGLLDVQVATADIVKRLVVEAERTIGVLQKGVGGEDRVVRLNDRSRDLRTGGDGKRELGFASIVDRETFQQERSETGTFVL